MRMESQRGSAWSPRTPNAPGSASKTIRPRRHNAVRNWVAAAILLLTVPTFAFVTCEVYVQLMSGARGDSRPGQRLDMRIRDARKAGSRRSLVSRPLVLPKEAAALEVRPPDVMRDAAAQAQAAADHRPMDVSIAVMTPEQFVEGFNGSIQGCTWRGGPLGCAFVPFTNDTAAHAAYAAAGKALAPQLTYAIFYHAPELCAQQWFNPKTRVRKSNPKQLAIMMSMESVGYYECFNDPAFMSEFDFEMTYRLDSQLPITYLRTDQMDAWMHDPVIPFEERLDAPVYVQSNCITPSRRDAIVGALMKFEDLGLKSYGRCLNTEGSHNGTVEDKISIYKRHKFCVIMENSIAPDYVTEKLYDAFVGGCVPIYYGATNIQNFLPDPESIVDYRTFSSVAALHAEVLRLTRDRAAWEAKVAWRRRPVAELSAPYRHLVEAAEGDIAQCQLCSAMADYKAGNTSEVDEFHAYWGPAPPPPPPLAQLSNTLLGDLMGV